jgi:hypothetical protein
MTNQRMHQQNPAAPDAQASAKRAIEAGLRAELQEVAEELRDLNTRSLAARDRQYRLIRRMIDGGATWDQTQFAAEVSRPTVMRAVRDGKRREVEAAEALELQHDAERAAFNQAMGDNPGLSPRP